jgi:site-specific DNA recombinase
VRVCQRRMEGTWNNDRPHYRCRFPFEYALANRIEHQRSVYLREDAVLPSLDGCLGRLFEPRNVHTTIDAIASALSTDASPAKTVTDEARRVADEVEQQLARYRAALDAGADPSVVASWIADAQTRRSRAEQVLRCRQAPTRMGRDEIEAVIRGLGDLFQTLRGAHPANKAEIYGRLGLQLTYDPAKKLVVVEADPAELCTKQSVGGGT